MIRYELTKPFFEIPFCTDTTGKTMELACFENHCKSFISFFVLDTALRYGIPAGGKFYCVLCEGSFVIAFKSVNCGWKEIRIRNGEHLCIIDEDGTGGYGTEHAPIQVGDWTLYPDSSILTDGTRWNASPWGRPFVYTRGVSAVDEEGNLIARKKNPYLETVPYKFIMAESDTSQCITSDRSILSKDGISSPNGELVVDIASTWNHQLALTQTGNVYCRQKDEEWMRLGTGATAIGTSGQHIAFADKAGRIHIFRHDENMVMQKIGVFRFPGKHISDLDLSDHNHLLGFLCSDGRYDVFDFQTGDRCIRRSAKSPRPAELSSSSAEIEQWDRPD